MRITLCEACGAFDAVRNLFEEYAASLGIDLSYQHYAEELACLPGKYARPDGRLYIARVDGADAGCAALRRFDGTACEMKRLYVRPAFRGLGLGEKLAVKIIEEAREAGYRAVLLDTLQTMTRAQALYAKLGFCDVPPYYDSPVEGTRYMRLTL